ncbi:MAG: oligosaccharide flippase family protein [Solirubrobacteraceae bacterium]
MVSRLTSVNVASLALGLVTGPIIARVLGAEGRGELAAITAVLAMAPWLLDFGLSLWLARERALGGRRSELLGAALLPALACSLTGVAAAIPLSHALGADRAVVVTFLQIGLFLMPVNVLLQALGGLALGESRWPLVAAARIIANVLPAVVIIALAAAGHLTVATAAAASMCGTVLSGLVFLPVVRGMDKLVFSVQRAGSAVAFGAKSWLSTIALAGNFRLDQILMAGLVTSRELGLYAVAVTIATLTGTLFGAVSSAVFPRVAQGDGALVARSCRVTVLIVGVTGVGLAAVSPTLIPFVFGEQFRGAVPMVLILLVASVPGAPASVLSSALNAANNPGAAMRAELVALALTVPALIILLPDLGGRGAALVSLGAYAIKLVLQVNAGCRTFDFPASSFLVPNWDDIVWLKRQWGGRSRSRSR